MQSTSKINGLIIGSSIRFRDWIPFNNALEYATTEIGVYCIRMKDAVKVGRVRGESDIVYLGSTIDGFKRRFRSYMHPGIRQKTSQRVKAFSQRYSLEVSFLPIAKPRVWESIMMDMYLGDHDELPPLNHQSIDRFHFRR